MKLELASIPNYKQYFISGHALLLSNVVGIHWDRCILFFFFFSSNLWDCRKGSGINNLNCLGQLANDRWM